eukprot:TRINITY_DN12183_c0_g1_i1.p1 TRINITY_DN12183_c0_g1~~TRINITY_DN12183_c0_g1_i1.p1  ORF type:complete len:182 (+),score=63.18 TRINITY_DN12183_c0_g1_i1:76-546(+)
MSLWKANQLAMRTQWRVSIDKRLDRRQGPLELTKGVTVRSLFKYSGFLVALAAVIAWGNNRAYQEHWSQMKATALPGDAAALTQKQLRKVEEDDSRKVQLTTRQHMEKLLQEVSEMTDDWNPDKLNYVKITRPPELTLDNLREAGMGLRAGMPTDK